jgi:hypothetical protein
MPEEQQTDLSDEMVKSDGFAPLGRMIEPMVSWPWDFACLSRKGMKYIPWTCM